MITTDQFHICEKASDTVSCHDKDALSVVSQSNITIIMPISLTNGR